MGGEDEIRGRGRSNKPKKKEGGLLKLIFNHHGTIRKKNRGASLN